MTFAQAIAIWKSSPTVKRGIDSHLLSTRLRLKRIDDHTFTIRHRDCDIITIHDNGRYTLSTGTDPQFKFVRKVLMVRYLPEVKSLRSFYNGITIQTAKEQQLL